MPLAELFGLVALRLAYPDVVVDLNRAAGLHGVRDEGDHLVIGAMTTHYEVIRSELVRRHCGLLAEATATVADPQVRHRGTFGGALSHADPAGDLPAVALAFGTTMVVAGPAGRRTVPASEFFADYLQTALEPAEVLVSAVAMPVLKRFGPVLGGLAFGLVLGLLLGHRRRIAIMTAAAPGSYPPARTVL